MLAGELVGDEIQYVEMVQQAHTEADDNNEERKLGPRARLFTEPIIRTDARAGR